MYAPPHLRAPRERAMEILATKILEAQAYIEKYAIYI
jgi:hypothetical protein